MPYAWQVIDGIAKHSPSACIGGGWLRDHMYKKPKKDIDVFMSLADWINFQSKCRWGNPRYWNKKEGEDYPSSDINVYALENTGAGAEVDVIVLTGTLMSPEEYIMNFPASICQIGYHIKQERLITTSAWEMTFKTGVVFYPDDTSEIQMKLLNKLEIKYPELKHLVGGMP